MTFDRTLSPYNQPGTLQHKMAVAVVVDNNDPMKIQRIKCRVSDLHSGRTPDELVWALQLTLSPQGHSGSVSSIGIPLIGSKVIIYFPEDDEHDQYYIADVNDKTSQTAELLVDYPNCYGHIDASGNLWFVNTLQDTVTFVHVSGSYYTFQKNGDVDIVAAKDLNFKAMGNINMDGVAINLQKGNASMLTTTPRTKPPAPSVPSNDF